MRDACRDRIAGLRFQGVFTPPSFQGTIIWPGNIGGMNWSGVSVDEARGILVAPTNRLATVVRLIPRDSLRAAYRAHPDLEYGRQTGTPYAMSRGHLGLCTPPPWGALTAIDLNAGAVKWQVPLGAMPQMAEVPGASGSVQLGGALTTAGGLVFIAGTFDQHLRAFDIETGREVWSAPLPAAAHALPMTYEANGRQYIVIAAGGHDRLHTTTGDYVVAYTLPGPGAPQPDTTSGNLFGSWTGEMHIGDARFGMSVTLTDSLQASVEMDSVEITEPVRAEREGRGVVLSFPIFYSGKGKCTANFRIELELWNGGTQLEGTGTFDGQCASDGHQTAAFVFRRPAR
jgi:outer membrane protein assembly factor BamB